MDFVVVTELRRIFAFRPETSALAVIHSKRFRVRCTVRRVFNAVMRLISSLVGILMVLMGGIWILQGLNLAWGSLSRSFMQGDQHWAVYGGIVLIIGLCEIVWSNTRQ